MAEPETVFEPPEKNRVVLIPVDGSAHSEKAFAFYMNDLHKDGDYVVIMNVPERPPVPTVPYQYPYGKVDYVEEYNEISRRMEEESKECLKTFGGKLREKFHEQNFKLIKEFGRPGEVIVHNAKEEEADLIVMGSRGLGVIRRTILGSVSEYVVHHSHLPTMIVH